MTDITEKDWLRALARWCIKHPEIPARQRADWIAKRIKSDVLAEEAARARR